LQLVADAFLGPDIVQVHNLGTGGTGSALATPTLRHGLYPTAYLQRHGPDIIINAYAANDNVWNPTYAAATTTTRPHGQRNTPYSNNYTNSNNTAHHGHWESALHDTQQFVREATTTFGSEHGTKSSSPRRRQPLVIYVDDHVGNFNKRLLGEAQRHLGVQTFADLSESILYIRPSQFTQRRVWSNTHETIFSPLWWSRTATTHQSDDDDDDVWTTNVHYRQSGHMVTVWTLCYSVLQVALEYCHDASMRQSSRTHRSLPDLNNNSHGDEEYQMLHVDHQLRVSSIVGTNTYAPRQPNDSVKEAVPSSRLHSHSPSCPFAFVASPSGTEPDAQALQNYLQPFVTTNTGWMAMNDVRQGWQNKVGLIASHPGATLTLTVTHITRPVRFLTIHWLRSYGVQWEGSLAQFDVQVVSSPVHRSSVDAAAPDIVTNHTLTLPGWHTVRTSTAYPYELDLGPPLMNATLEQSVHIRVTLLQGPQFKLLSLLLCSE
jgi:hypothetical protein